MSVALVLLSLLLNMNSQVHNICNSGPGPCSDKFSQLDAQMAVIGGPSHQPWKSPGPVTVKYPMSASCAVCKDEAVSSRKNLKQCARCKFTR